MNRNERLTGILLALQGGRKTATQLAGRFEVSRRTILRDIDALSQIGVPVVALPGSGGGYELSEGFWLPPLHLTADEAALLLLALESFGATEDSPFGPARLTAEEKLRAVLPAPVLRDAERQLGAISVETPHRRERLHHLPAIRHAVIDRRWLRIGYQSSRRVAEHTVFPLRLFVNGNRWYLAAASQEATEERVYRIDRIQSAALVPPPANAGEVLAAVASNGKRDSGERVRVSATVSYTAMRRLEDHPDFAGRVIEEGDGGWLTFDTPPAELDYFARELFALGPEVTVLEPETLRARILALAMSTAQRYVQNGDTTVSPIDP